jgi:hypothetical protein
VNNTKDKIDIRSLSLNALQEHFIRMDEKASGQNRCMSGFGKNLAFLLTR